MSFNRLIKLNQLCLWVRVELIINCCVFPIEDLHTFHVKILLNLAYKKGDRLSVLEGVI